MSSSGSDVAVLGSINIDTLITVQSLPRAGETVQAQQTTRALGGKGANQAVAAALAGAKVSLIGAVGCDEEAAFVVDQLAASGLEPQGLIRSSEHPCGRATVILDSDGQNVIVIDEGANAAMTPRAVRAAARTIASADVFVVQCEIPHATIAEGLLLAKDSGTRAVVNLAPFLDLRSHISAADPLVLNEVEAEQYLDRPLSGLRELAAAAAEIRTSCQSVIITLGAQGALIADRDEIVHLPADAVGNVVDSTGAGDAFVGVLAARLAQGHSLIPAAAAAVRAASLSVQFLGAASGYPSFEDIY